MDLKLNLKLRLMRDEEVAMGPGKADLLEAIAEAGSISGAARSMGMSYRRAWLLVDVMNRCFQKPLVHSAAGGAQGGGATDRGRPRRAGALPQHGGGGDRGRAGASRPAVTFAETGRREKSRRRLTFNADLQRLSTTITFRKRHADFFAQRDDDRSPPWSGR